MRFHLATVGLLLSAALLVATGCGPSQAELAMQQEEQNKRQQEQVEVARAQQAQGQADAQRAAQVAAERQHALEKEKAQYTFSFMGFGNGQSSASMEANANAQGFTNLKCEDVKSEIKVCTGGNASTSAYIGLAMVHGQLAQLEYRFPHRDYGSVVREMKEQYGAPMTEDNLESNVEHGGKLCVWKTPKANIGISEFAPKNAEQGRAVLVDNRLKAELAQVGK